MENEQLTNFLFLTIFIVIDPLPIVRKESFLFKVINATTQSLCSYTAQQLELSLIVIRQLFVAPGSETLRRRVKEQVQNLLSGQTNFSV